MTLAKSDSNNDLLAKQIRALASETYGYNYYPEKNFAHDVLKPLQDTGFLFRNKEGKGEKFTRTPNKKVTKTVVIPLLKQFEDANSTRELRPFHAKMVRRHVKKLCSQDASVGRGLALETLAIELMLIIDLEYSGTRVRGKRTGGGEVDVIFHSAPAQHFPVGKCSAKMLGRRKINQCLTWLRSLVSTLFIEEQHNCNGSQRPYSRESSKLLASIGARIQTSVLL